MLRLLLLLNSLTSSTLETEKIPQNKNFITTHFFFSTLSLKKECKSLHETKLHHQQILVKGLEHFTEGNNTIIDIISMYVSCDAPLYALKALERLTPSPSVVYWWNAHIRRDVRLGFLDNALDIYLRMQRLGWKADYFTYPFVLKASGEIPSLKRGTLIHSVVCCNGFDSNVFVCNALVAMYSRCGAFEETRQVFVEMYEREMDDVVSWNSIVAAYMQSGNLSEALKMFGRMTKDIRFLPPDAVSLVNVLLAFGSSGAVVQGKQAHAFVFDEMYEREMDDVVLLYAKCGMMGETKVFDIMGVKDVVSWNAI